RSEPAWSGHGASAEPAWSGHGASAEPAWSASGADAEQVWSGRSARVLGSVLGLSANRPRRLGLREDARENGPPVPQPAERVPVTLDELHEGTASAAVLQKEDVARSGEHTCTERAASKRETCPIELDLEAFGRD